MHKHLLIPERDPMGRAIADYHAHKRVKKLHVLSSMFDKDEMSVEYLFRNHKEMPELELMALDLTRGRVLDVGAGSGCHALTLQSRGQMVTAIDISPLAVEVMKERGVNDARAIDFYDEMFLEQYDTILMLMNGSGIIGKVSNLPAFFRRVKQLLAPGGRLLMDSSDLRYLYENEDGSLDINLNGNYYGEVDFQMQYGGVRGEKFNWLYIDQQTLKMYAAEAGFRVEIVKEGSHYDYLAKITSYHFLK